MQRKWWYSIGLSGAVSATDVDAGATKTWSVEGANSTTYGAFEVNAETGVWTYTLDNSLAATQALKEGESVTQTYTAPLDTAGAAGGARGGAGMPRANAE